MIRALIIRSHGSQNGVAICKDSEFGFSTKIYHQLQIPMCYGKDATDINK